MNEPILGKARAHGYDYKPITWKAFIRLCEASQQVANKFGFPVYLVGSALYKEIPRDIDISVIIPIEEYIKMFGELPQHQDNYGKYLADVIEKSCNQCIEIIDMQFCIDYHLDIKICSNTWWLEKPKMLLAEPKN